MRNKTSRELAKESKTTLIICDAVGCESYARFILDDGKVLCNTHLAMHFHLEMKTDQPKSVVYDE